MMRRPILVLLTAVSLAGCEDATAPSLVARHYALGRIGLTAPPIPQGPDGGAPWLLADTLALDSDRSRDNGTGVMTRIQVIRDGQGVTHRQVTAHRYLVEGTVFSYDSCPIDALCLASLVHAPISFAVIGDSLFQSGPEASPLPGAVYGRIRGH
jgi:hypothetical protein